LSIILEFFSFNSYVLDFGLEGGVLGLGLGSCGLGLEVCVLGLALALGVMSLLISLHNTRASRPRPIFWSQTSLELRPTVSDHITGNGYRLYSLYRLN